MAKIDWKKGPSFSQVQHVIIPEHEVYYLDNGLKVFEVNMGTQDVLKIELIYKGARLLEEKRLCSKFASALLREGTASYSSSQLAETMDFYGAMLRTGANLDYNYITLSFLTKYAHQLIPILEEVCAQPSFPESEFLKYQNNSISKLSLDLSKNELLCYRLFTERLFGKDHPYGYNTELEDIKSLTNNDVKSFFKSAHGTNNSFLVVCGKVNQEIRNNINLHLGKTKNEIFIPLYKPVISVTPENRIFHQTKNEFQCALKFGRRLFNRHHEDFTKFFVFNTILGGYFGSRLMTSLREDLGFTYNIYSVVDHLIHDGYFYIDTEMDPKYLNATEIEINKQIHLLKTVAVGDDEMKMVKSYLMGNFLNLVDGPFNVSNLLRSLEIDGIDVERFNLFIEEIKSVTNSDIMEMANKYFNEEELVKVIVGP